VERAQREADAAERVSEDAQAEAERGRPAVAALRDSES